MWRYILERSSAPSQYNGCRCRDPFFYWQIFSSVGCLADSWAQADSYQCRVACACTHCKLCASTEHGSPSLVFYCAVTDHHWMVHCFYPPNSVGRSHESYRQNPGRKPSFDASLLLCHPCGHALLHCCNIDDRYRIWGVQGALSTRVQAHHESTDLDVADY